jgi:hypothetical protein
MFKSEKDRSNEKFLIKYGNLFKYCIILNKLPLNKKRLEKIICNNSPIE